MGIRTLERVIASLSPIPVVRESALGVGDQVMYTNDYGVTFGPHRVVGFDTGEGLLVKWGKHIYIDNDSYWCPVAEDSLTLVSPNRSSKKVCLGTIVKKDGFITLQTRPNVWYPLGGASWIAHRFREAFNDPAPADIGRRLWSVDGVLQLEAPAATPH